MIGIVDSLLRLPSLFGFLEGEEVAVSGDGYMPDQHFIDEFLLLSKYAIICVLFTVLRLLPLSVSISLLSPFYHQSFPVPRSQQNRTIFLGL